MSFRNQQLTLPTPSIPLNRDVHNIYHICQTPQTAELEPDSKIQITNSEQQNHLKSLQGLRTCLSSPYPKKKYLDIFNGKGLEIKLIYTPSDH